MIHATLPIHPAGFFPIHGQGDGESCPQRMKFTISSPPEAWHHLPSMADPAGSMPVTTHFAHATKGSRPPQPLLREKLQTQNA